MVCWPAFLAAAAGCAPTPPAHAVPAPQPRPQRPEPTALKAVDPKKRPWCLLDSTNCTSPSNWPYQTVWRYRPLHCVCLGAAFPQMGMCSTVQREFSCSAERWCARQSSRYHKGALIPSLRLPSPHRPRQRRSLAGSRMKQATSPYTTGTTSY
jgi:hypothetical protein